MKLYFFITLFFLFSVQCTSESNVGPQKKHAINFYGTLKTHQGNTFKVENIAIENKYCQIPMYDRPDKKNLSEPVINKETEKLEIHLQDNPKNFSTTQIDLEESDEIEVTNEPIYVYQQKEHRPIFFVHVAIISKNNKTRHDYLMPELTRVSCDEINETGPIEKTVPLSAIKSLKIEGFSQRISPENNNGPVAK